MRDRFLLTLEPRPSPVPVFVRLRRLLKHALRALSLRCVRATYADGRPLALETFPMAPPTKDRLTEAMCNRLSRIRTLTEDIHQALPECEADVSDTAEALLQLDAVVTDLEDVLDTVRGEPEPDGEAFREIGS